MAGAGAKRNVVIKHKYVIEPHALTQKVCHWPVCRYCGLVALKNDVSREAVRLGCNWRDK